MWATLTSLTSPYGPATTELDDTRTYAGIRARAHVKLVRPIPLAPWGGVVAKAKSDWKSGASRAGLIQASRF
jgi:hypothetical protein